MDLLIKPSKAELLQNQLQNLAAESLPGKIKLIIYRNIQLLKAYTETYVKVREDMFKQLGTPFNGDYAILKFTGEKMDIPNPKYDQYLKEIGEVDTEVEIKGIEQLPRDIFDSDREFKGDLSMIYEKLLA